MSSTPTRMPDYNPMGRARFKSILDRGDTTPRVGRILGIPAQELVDTVGLACCAGFGLMFSPTADGGAIGVHLYAGDSKLREYAASPEELSAVLSAVRDRSEAHLAGGTTSKPNGAVRASQRT